MLDRLSRCRLSPRLDHPRTRSFRVLDPVHVGNLGARYGHSLPFYFGPGTYLMYLRSGNAEPGTQTFDSHPSGRRHLLGVRCEKSSPTNHAITGPDPGNVESFFQHFSAIGPPPFEFPRLNPLEWHGKIVSCRPACVGQISVPSGMSSRVQHHNEAKQINFKRLL